MNRGLRTALLCVFLILTGCAKRGVSSLPYDAWYLGFVAPTHMAVWIEAADVLDIRDRGFWRVMGGGARMDFSHRPEDGWSERTGVGSGKYISGSDLPKMIRVRWQSLAEMKTYDVVVEVPQSARNTMLTAERVYCRLDGKVVPQYRTYLTIGLAPGGIAQAWLRGVCLDRIQVTRAVGRSVPSEDGYLPLEPESQAYIDAHGIPYGAW